MEAERAEKLEAEIDSLLERRAREERDAAPIEEAWKGTTRRHNEQRRRENSLLWREYHTAMREVHSRLPASTRLEFFVFRMGCPVGGRSVADG
jgi:hypothetical protein